MMTDTRNTQSNTVKEPHFSCMIGLPSDGWCGKCGCYHYREQLNRSKSKSSRQRELDRLMIAEPKVTLTIAGVTMDTEIDIQDQLIEGEPLYGLNLNMTHQKEF